VDPGRADGKLPPVSDPQEPQAEPLTLEETARATAELATRPEASRLATSFLELVQRWAAPSAVLTAVRDPAGVAGFRLVPSLCNGSISLGIEKTLAKLVEETPQCLARPTLVRGEEMPGVRVRDNVVVPWWCEADSGLLVLRGVPRPVRPGLGEALALTAAVVWPRLLYLAIGTFVLGLGLLLCALAFAALDLRLSLDPVRLETSFVQRRTRRADRV